LKLRCDGLPSNFAFELNLRRYTMDLKNLYQQAGIQGVPTVFLFTDTQIVNEGFIEDINNLLNSGEVPGLFAPDEKERIMSDIRPYCDKLGLAGTKAGAYTRSLFSST